MLLDPIVYDEPLYRPPSEAHSLILQITLGCSWNKCAFCEMYTSKRFTVRKQEDLFKEIEQSVSLAPYVTKIFLADGDPLVLSNERLLPILERINTFFPRLERIAAYASPANLNKKTLAELTALKEAGLRLVYVGIESGDDTVLKVIQKGETHESIISGLQKAHTAGIDSSVMIINGVGGKLLSHQHALQSAKLLNTVQPKYASTLVLTTHKGLEHFQDRFLGEFIPLDRLELFREMRLFMEHLELQETLYRSNHASNRLVLKGVLGKDKAHLLEQIDEAIAHPENPHGSQFFYPGF